MACEPVALEPGDRLLNHGAGFEDLFEGIRCVDAEACCDQATAAYVSLLPNWLSAEAMADRRDYDRYDLRPIADLRAEAAVHAGPGAGDSDFRTAVRTALNWLPVVVSVRFEDALATKRVVPGQRVQLSARYTGGASTAVLLTPPEQLAGYE